MQPTQAPWHHYPTWLREIDALLPSAPHMVLTGNTQDIHLVPNPYRYAPDGSPGYHPMTTEEALTHVLTRAGFTAVQLFHPVTGLAMAAAPPAPSEPRSGDLGVAADELITALGALHTADTPTALIVSGAGRFAAGGDHADPVMHRLITVAEHHLATSRARPVLGHRRAPLYPVVVWVLSEPNELPSWFMRRREVRLISVPEPTLGVRHAFARANVSGLPEFDPAHEDRVVERFSTAASGLPLRAMAEVHRLAIDRGIPAAQIEDAVRLFRVGIPDNPWQDPALRHKITHATDVLGKRVLGQPWAIRKAVDILMRSTSGLTGAQSRSSGSRPQGVLFFAGPTGVGKTELAKALAELVFGQQDAVTRFDMSEFSAEHSEARLIGSPPGYIGHDAGGELVNAVRENPFSLLLFDEIDKAHGRILDKFLQILEDGRLTGGNGSTVHFSESLIVFTSNLGIYEEGPDGRRHAVVERGVPYAQVEEAVLASVKRHFTERLGRPEILNRIGDNVVVFDFLSPAIARQLVPNVLRNVASRLAEERGLTLTWHADVEAELVAASIERLDFGGRAVGSAVETMFINPLARALFSYEGQAAHVTKIESAADGWAVELR